ncbi:glycosyltransferase family 2 protein [Motiliproteus sp. SC1-56]|uniref:glycosyltransferase family 2 protein n=1 Tax=Motiliproteus sp. SC1-56 TaxID=2799565 RepID=UPI001A8CC1A8|nr:glycosyltransferase family 2 protein [Motiliproteus sp. SC1-56]
MAELARGQWLSLARDGSFAVIVGALVYGGLVYQLARLSYLKRAKRHRRASRANLEAVFDQPDAPPLAILVPSYKEEPRVVLATLLSAVLQEYPNRRVTLLIDDPPTAHTSHDAALLEEARSLPMRICQMLAEPAAQFSAALDGFEQRRAAGDVDVCEERQRLVGLYRRASLWFGATREQWHCEDHADQLFCSQVLARQALALASRAAELSREAPSDARFDVNQVAREYRRLASLFNVKIDSFERKHFANLSHEPNKAMNLNSYIGIMGSHLRYVESPQGTLLEACPAEEADLSVADAEFLITLDADSIIVPDYGLRLIHEMQKPANTRLAVVQTPYSAVPGAPGVLERVAGATTDIQYIIHQGFTGWGSTFWVGANALLRKEALEAIAEEYDERGFTVRRYIQDRTVIEDTESSIDLIDRGWQLHNYPERLAFSATPPDFGSLLIQRRRWANGGLIILPKLLAFLGRGPGRLRKLPQAFMRIHYLASIALVNTGLLIVLALPLTDNIQSLWLPLTALPYFALYSRDLIQLGYRASDMVRVYALNLVLIPVNLGGVLKSVQQFWTKEKIPFGRTPKVQGRTAAAPLYVVALYLILFQWIISAGLDVTAERWLHAGFAGFNAALLLYGILAFVGLRESFEDLRQNGDELPSVQSTPSAAGG